MKSRHIRDKTLAGIYELDGDTLIVCFAKPGEPRPTEFTTQHGTAFIYCFQKATDAASRQLRSKRKSRVAQQVSGPPELFESLEDVGALPTCQPRPGFNHLRQTGIRNGTQKCSAQMSDCSIPREIVR
ncbi:MAG: hypothetical protein SGJ20_07225 [Planctomycetota bacterium]|nr:hypothetical protein [Planctomycetota bacterium]